MFFPVSTNRKNETEIGRRLRIEPISIYLFSMCFAFKKIGKNDSNKIIFVFICREALPRLENYRRSLRALKRPSLGRLHGEDFEINQVSIFLSI